MHLQIRGIVLGKNIELERETGLPDGSGVTVQINSGELSLDERRRRLHALCGAWKDESLDAIFREVAEHRMTSAGREVDFDCPS